MKRVAFLVVLPTLSTVIRQATNDAWVSDPDGYNIAAVSGSRRERRRSRAEISQGDFKRRLTWNRRAARWNVDSTSSRSSFS